MKLIFFGTRRHGLELLRELVKSQHEIACVTTEDHDMDEITSEDFQKICKEHHIDFYKGEKIENNEFQKLYASYNADLGVCIGWRKLIREKILSTTKFGFIGPHSSELPKYRGFASSVYAILNGDPYCGFCIMKYKPAEADTGEICKRFRVSIDENMTIKDLIDKSGPLTVKHMLEVINEFQSETIQLEKQDESKVILSYPRLPEDGEIDWNQSAQKIHNLIRAVTKPYPGAFTFFKSRKLYIWKSEVFKNPPQFIGQPGHIVHLDDQVCVLTGSGILILKECQFADQSQSIDPKTNFKFHRLRLGLNLVSEVERLNQQIQTLEEKLQQLHRIIEKKDN